MKHFFKLLFTLLFSLTSLSAYGQQQEETQQILYPSTQSDGIYTIAPDSHYEQEVVFDKSDIPLRRYLRIVGGTMMPGKFAKRGETLFREAEYLIDDHLDSLTTKDDHYSLFFKGNNDPYERHAYCRLSDSAFVNTRGEVEINIMAKKENLETKNGDFGIEFQIYYKKQGRHNDEIYDAPDDRFFLPIEEGSGDFSSFSATFKPKREIANILVRLGGTSFSGECWLESPKFSQAGKPLTAIPFVKNADRTSNHNYWVGVNLVSRFWPMWRVEFNGKVIFKDHIFDRSSNIADFYIKLPNDLEGQGSLKLILEKEPHKAAFPYEMHSMQIIEEAARDFEIASTPKFITVGDTTGLLIEINKPNITLAIKTGDGIQVTEEKRTFAQTGLHVIPLTATKSAINIPVEIRYNDEIRIVRIKQTILKDRDEVYLSSGDEIYIDKEFEPYDHFFKWYMRKRIGNWYHFRPSYQWSGVRITTDDFVKHYTTLLNQMKMPYAWQVEGRTLASTRINPSLEVLRSPMFKGKQAHENDGGYYYWQHFNYEGLHSDMSARARPYGGIFAKHRPIYTDHGIFIHYDTHYVKDMAQGARYLVDNFKYSRGESTRHTGPSTVFRYLYQAGYEWLGAEQMYGPEDIIMSSLRGASRAYGKKEYGSLHAVQWGSGPFTDPKHSLRLYNSLAVAYMHGSSHINTEEGIWLDEYSNDYFSQSGKEHRYAQNRILDYIETHSRRGEMDTKIAVIHGRNDAWKSFGRQSVWSQHGEKWKFNKALESFDLLKVFYPDNIVDGCGPEGWFTSTPYGAIDIVPIEADDKVLSNYKALIFLGWNSYDEKDFDRISTFVRGGGTLLLSAAHLNSELQPNIAPRLPNNDKAVRALLGNNYETLKEKTVITHGKGKVIYFPQNSYPIEDEIRKEYRETMHQLGQDIVASEKSKGWIGANPHIDFTVWESNDLRTIYILNTDWKSDKSSQPAVLHLDKESFNLDIKRHSLNTMYCSKYMAIKPKSNTTDVLKIEDHADYWNIQIQTTEKDNIKIFNGLNGNESNISITSAGIHSITVKKK